MTGGLIYNTENVPYKKQTDKKVWLVDFSFYIYSGSFAMKRECKCKGKNQNCSECSGSGKRYMQNSSGFITGGLYTIISQIVYAKKNGYEVIIAFDPPKAQLTRTLLLPTYKGNRKPVAEWITAQKDLGLELFPKTAIECYCSHHDESDDILATIAVEKAREGYSVVLASDDKDFFPLLEDENIKLFRKRQIFDKKDFINTFGFSPRRFVDYLAICGDSADNFNLLPGLGEVAAKWIIENTEDSCMEVFDIFDKIPNKYQKKLVKLDDNEKIIRTLEDELVLSLKLSQLNLTSDYFSVNKNVCEDEVSTIFDFLEFNSAKKELELFLK